MRKYDQDEDVHSYKDMEKLQKTSHLLNFYFCKVHPLRILSQFPISLECFSQFLEDIQL